MSRALLVAVVLLVSGAAAWRCVAQPTLVSERQQPLRYQGANDGGENFTFALPGRRYLNCGTYSTRTGTQASGVMLAVIKQNGDTVRFMAPRTHTTGNCQVFMMGAALNPDHSLVAACWYTPNPPTAATRDSLLLFCLDTLGTIRWRRAYRPLNGINGAAQHLLRTGDGYLLCTNNDAFPNTSGPLFLKANVIKFDFQGRIVWERAMPSRGYGGVGALTDVVACPDGSYLATGYADDGTPYTPGTSARGRLDYFAVRFNTDGDTLRTYRFGAAGVDESGTRLRPTPDGGWALIGYRLRSVPPGSNRPQDGQLFKLDSLFRPQWSKTIAYLPRTDINWLYALLQPLANGDVLAGGSNNNVGFPAPGQLTAYDATGAMRWDYQHLYQGQYISFATMVNHPDGSALLTGTTGTGTGNAHRDYAYSAYLTNVGIPYVADLCARPPVAGFAPALSAGRDSLFAFNTSLAGPRYAALVAWRWEWGDGTSSDQVQPPWHRYATVPASGTAVRLTVTNNLGCTSTCVEYPWGGRPTATAAPAALAAGATLYPNPASGPLTLTVPQWPGAGPVAVQVLDGLGRVVQTGAARVAGGTLTAGLDVRGLPAGIYAVRVLAPAGSLTKRLVRE